jgi:hypothetical protein
VEKLAGRLHLYLRGARLAYMFPAFWLAFFTRQNALLAPAASARRSTLQEKAGSSVRYGLAHRCPH